MGAMLVGLITGIPLMIMIYSFITVSAILIVSIAFFSYQLKMNVLWWTLAAFVMNFSVLIPFIIAVKKISKNKICPTCGSRSRNSAGFCPACGANSKAFDDTKFIKRILLIISILMGIYYAYSFISTLVYGL